MLERYLITDNFHLETEDIPFEHDFQIFMSP
jgi:hypothetical protein